MVEKRAYSSCTHNNNIVSMFPQNISSYNSNFLSFENPCWKPNTQKDFTGDAQGQNWLYFSCCPFNKSALHYQQKNVRNQLPTTQYCSVTIKNAKKSLLQSCWGFCVCLSVVCQIPCNGFKGSKQSHYSTVTLA